MSSSAAGCVNWLRIDCERFVHLCVANGGSVTTRVELYIIMCELTKQSVKQLKGK